MEDAVPFAYLLLDLLLAWLLSLLSFWFNHLDTNYKLDLNYTFTSEKIILEIFASKAKFYVKSPL